jgi:hypothetical protein
MTGVLSAAEGGDGREARIVPESSRRGVLGCGGDVSGTIVRDVPRDD